MHYKTLLLLVFISFNTQAKLKVATFAGGCFWCMEPPFEKMIGVSKVISGYSGGTKVSPSYSEVSAGKTSHREVVQVSYDDSLVSYKQLLEIFWSNINPEDSKGQFVDRGFQYSPAIFAHDETQFSLARKSVAFLKSEKIFNEINTPIIKYTSFYPAEEYHQDYYKKNLVTKTKYKYYRAASGRDTYLEKKWKGSELRINFLDNVYRKNISKLTKLQIEVTQNDGTEPAFNNKYWDNKQDGIYVDIVSKEPLFSSRDKYKSGTGWPSFTKAIDPYFLVYKDDSKLFAKRTEVRSRFSDSHLGHVFNDGPAPLNQRYCMNSASLEFIPKKDLVKRGFGQYLKLFL